MQAHRQINVKQPNTQTYPSPQPANSSWLQSRANQGSISMQRDDSNGNQLQQNTEDKNKTSNSNSDEKEDGVESLASEFSTPFTVFMSIIIISTMSLFIYSNSQDGAFVQVQVTPKLPRDVIAHSFIISENVTPWTASQTIFSYKTKQSDTDTSIATKICNKTSHDKNAEIESMIYGLIEYVQEFQSKYPYLKIFPTYDNGIDFDYLYSHRKNLTALLSELGVEEMYKPETYKYEIFSFTLTSSIDDFWQAGAYQLAFVIAAFSGAWPYIKLLLLLVVWLNPMKPSQRQKGLLFLDQFGKFSFVDLYVCIFMVVSFYLVIAEQTKQGLGIEVAVIVQIDTGVSTFAVATIVSMIYSMLFILFDEKKRFKRRQKEIAKNEYEKYDVHEDDNIPMVFNVDSFENHIEKHSSLYEWKYDKSFKIYALYDLPQSFVGVICRCIFLIVCIANIWLCIETIYTAPVRYNMKGLAGWAIDDNVRSYTIKHTADLLPDSTDEIGAAYFCVIQYYITVIIAPILICTVVVCVWLVPMNYRMHNLICHLLYPLQAWNALDVFLLGTVAASVELDQVSQWILNTNFPCVCGDHGIIQSIVHVGCFSVVGNLTPGTIMLVVFVVVQWTTLIYTTKHINKAHQRLAKFNFDQVIN